MNASNQTDRRSFLTAATAAIGGATLADAALAVDTPSPSQIAAYKRRHHSPAAVELNLIVAAVDQLSGRINRFLAHHGEGCHCPYCSADSSSADATAGEAIETDLRGLSWCLEASGFIESAVCTIAEPELSKLAARYGIA